MNRNRYVFIVPVLVLGGILLISGMVAVTTEAQTGVSAAPYFFPDRGGVSLSTSGSDTPSPAVLYARIQPDAGSTTPSGIGIFGFRNVEGMLITEAGVPASPLVQSGRIFVVFDETILNTGVAFANPNDQAVTVQLSFNDPDVTETGVEDLVTSIEVAANGQAARFVSEDPLNIETGNAGVLTFTSALPISAVALREMLTSRGEKIYSSLPIVNIEQTSTDTVFLPHFVDGAGWRTEVFLVNPTDQVITGRVGFISQGSSDPNCPPRANICVGQTVAIPVAGDVPQSDNTYLYAITPRGFQVLTTAGASAFLSGGSVRARPDDGTPSPVAHAVFSNTNANGVVVSEAAVPSSVPGAGFRLFVEESIADGVGAIGSIRTGVAVANLAFDRATVNLELTDLGGNFLGSTQVSVAESGQLSFFLDEAFTAGNVPAMFSGPFRGILRVTTITPGTTIVVTGLRSRTNERGEFIFTTTPVANEAGTTTTAEFLFPHLVDGGGWTTETILFSGIAGQTGSGVMRFFGQDGQPFPLPLQ